MKQVLLFIWQLPQDIIGLTVILVTKAVYCNKGCWVTAQGRFGVSLGDYIILGQVVNNTDLKHEQGHQKQSLYLGPSYLLLVGLPSVLGNIWDRLFHKKWSDAEREKWYYSRYPENWADKLGDVKRF